MGRLIGYWSVDSLFRQNRKSKTKRFERFLRSLAEKKPNLLHQAFVPLARLSIEGTWTTIDPDPYISVEKGKEFFKNLKELQKQMCSTNLESSKPGTVFGKIENCRVFVYQVRNYMFHGTKDLGKIWDDNQKKRIEVYNQFLNCLVSSFFLLVKDTDVA